MMMPGDKNHYIKLNMDTRIFDKKSFLRSGALYGKGDQIFLLWGKREILSECPSDLAVCRRGFFDEGPLFWQSFEKGVELGRDKAREFFEIKCKKWHWKAPLFEEFKKQFVFLQKAFVKEGLKKGVPYVFETSGERVGMEDLESMIASGLREKKGFLFGEWNSEQGIIGLSPELLVSQESSGKFKTMAVAATLTLEKFERNPDELVKDNKQIQEHEWVVRDIENQLIPLAECKVGKCTTVKTSTLVHLMTPIEFEAKNQLTIDQVVHCLHPTAALGCSPRSLWKNVMKQFDEWNSRGSFGAPFGFSFHSKWVDFVVAIRCLIWRGENLKLGAGCGILPLSDMEQEWRELVDKRESVKRIFTL